MIFGVGVTILTLLPLLTTFFAFRSGDAPVGDGMQLPSWVLKVGLPIMQLLLMVAMYSSFGAGGDEVILKAAFMVLPLSIIAALAGAAVPIALVVFEMPKLAFFLMLIVVACIGGATGVIFKDLMAVTNRSRSKLIISALAFSAYFIGALFLTFVVFSHTNW